MIKIVVCYKWVLDEVGIRLNANQSLDTSQAEYKISDYDRNTIQAGVSLARELEGEAVGLTFGTAEARPSIKAALSRGLDEAYWVNAEEAAKADGAATARALAGAIKKIEDVQLVLCTEGASDTFARQIGPRVGALLDLPTITSVFEVSVEGTTLTATRKLKDSLETVEVELPCVVVVLPEIGEAPIPGLKAVLAAGKKPVHEFVATDIEGSLAPKTAAESESGYVMVRKNVVIKDGNAESKVAEFVSHLKKEGLV